jgi:hypothetical protein
MTDRDRRIIRKATLMLVGLLMGSVVGACFPYRDYHSGGGYQNQSNRGYQNQSGHYQPPSNDYRPPPDRQQQHSEH